MLGNAEVSIPFIPKELLLSCGRRLALLPLILSLISVPACAKRWDVLSKAEQATLQRILGHWETWVSERKKKGTAPLMTFDELYEGLGEAEQRFLNRVRLIDPRKDFDFQGNFLGTDRGGVKFKKIKGQKIRKGGKTEVIDTQYVPMNVYRAYERVMKAMKKDLGKRLLVESGFRSPAYQLYTFLYYTPKHHYSLVETGHWVALPGYSEHGAPHRQAVDFINEEGINGEDNVEEFERLPEYLWLLRNAHRFGFELSYPRDKPGITFEPWHWRYIGE